MGLFDLSAYALLALSASERISQVNVVYHCGRATRALPLDPASLSRKKA